MSTEFAAQATGILIMCGLSVMWTVACVGSVWRIAVRFGWPEWAGDILTTISVFAPVFVLMLVMGGKP